MVSQRLADQMNWAFDDSCVHGWEPLVGSYRLPDPDDEHLVAAAVIGGAQASCGRPLRQPAASIATWRSMR